MGMSKFDELLRQIPQIGLAYHGQTILENTHRNARRIGRTLRDVSPDHRPACVLSAGPSLYRGSTLPRLAEGQEAITIVATDGAYIQCLKAGIEPDWVVTIDPHPTRIAVLFGAESQDDYFKRTRADHGFEQEKENRELVDAHPANLVIATSAPQSVVDRTEKFNRFWFVPLVDDPDEAGLTRSMCQSTGAPALNTGGTVGTAAWAFAHQILKSTDIAVVGMDFGYPVGTAIEHTQEWKLTGGDPDLYPRRGDYYTSPTYEFYRLGLMDLLEAADARITNCSEGGLLDGDRVKRMKLEEWLASSS